jgi:hypothetical protein
MDPYQRVVFFDAEGRVLESSIYIKMPDDDVFPSGNMAAWVKSEQPAIKCQVV